jgi:hypothetical protein
MAQIKVTAAQGRTVPLHPSYAGGTAVTFLKFGDPAVEVNGSDYNVQRAIRDGDLVQFDEQLAAEPSLALPVSVAVGASLRFDVTPETK